MTIEFWISTGIVRNLLLGSCISVIMAMFTGCGSSSHGDGRSLVSDFGESTPTVEGFEPIYMVRPFEPIVDFPLVDVDEADNNIDDKELVLGVVINETARAYPVNQLMGPSREIINDELGGTEIAATW